MSRKKAPIPTHPNYERKGRRYEPHEVLDEVVFEHRCGRKNPRRAAQKVDFDGDLIDMTSDRYQCFAMKGVACAVCGLEGQYFIKERNASDPRKEDNTPYHFNLYGVKDGVEILFTKDHIVPRSKGGPNNVSNYRTCCKICNELKGCELELVI